MLDPTQPTDAQPGSEEKLHVMAARLKKGLPLHIPGDLQLPSGWDEGRKSVFEIQEIAVEEGTYDD